jgi:hypothetical protein
MSSDLPRPKSVFFPSLRGCLLFLVNTYELMLRLPQTLSCFLDWFQLSRCHMFIISCLQIYRDRKVFSSRVFEVASSDLAGMGIVVISYTIKEVSDEVGYLKVGTFTTKETKTTTQTTKAMTAQEKTIMTRTMTTTTTRTRTSTIEHQKIIH